MEYTFWVAALLAVLSGCSVRDQDEMKIGVKAMAMYGNGNAVFAAPTAISADLTTSDIAGAVCKVYVPSGIRPGRNCSGVLINRAVVLTSEECVPWAPCVETKTCNGEGNDLGVRVYFPQVVGSEYGVVSMQWLNPYVGTSADGHTLVALGLNMAVPSSTVEQLPPMNLRNVVDLFNDCYPFGPPHSTCGQYHPALSVGAGDGSRSVGMPGLVYLASSVSDNYQMWVSQVDSNAPDYDELDYSIYEERDTGGALFLWDAERHSYVLAGIAVSSNSALSGLQRWAALGIAMELPPVDMVSNVLELLSDKDQDGVEDAEDNCPPEFCWEHDLAMYRCSNMNQKDSDWDPYGDTCDNCPLNSNLDQADGDNDGFGDACDYCPDEISFGSDSDGDGVGDECETCQGTIWPFRICYSDQDCAKTGEGRCVGPDEGPLRCTKSVSPSLQGGKCIEYCNYYVPGTDRLNSNFNAETYANVPHMFDRCDPIPLYSFEPGLRYNWAGHKWTAFRGNKVETIKISGNTVIGSDYQSGVVSRTVSGAVEFKYCSCHDYAGLPYPCSFKQYCSESTRAANSLRWKPMTLDSFGQQLINPAPDPKLPHSPAWNMDEIRILTSWLPSGDVLFTAPRRLPTNGIWAWGKDVLLGNVVTLDKGEYVWGWGYVSAMPLVPTLYNGRDSNLLRVTMKSFSVYSAKESTQDQSLAPGMEFKSRLRLVLNRPDWEEADPPFSFSARGPVFLRYVDKKLWGFQVGGEWASISEVSNNVIALMEKPDEWSFLPPQEPPSEMRLYNVSSMGVIMPHDRGALPLRIDDSDGLRAIPITPKYGLPPAIDWSLSSVIYSAVRSQIIQVASYSKTPISTFQLSTGVARTLPSKVYTSWVIGAAFDLQTDSVFVANQTEEGHVEIVRYDVNTGDATVYNNAIPMPSYDVKTGALATSITGELWLIFGGAFETIAYQIMVQDGDNAYVIGEIRRERTPVGDPLFWENMLYLPVADKDGALDLLPLSTAEAMPY